MDARRDILKGRVAVVTGSSRGLGFAMAQVLGRNGAAVVLASRSDSDVAAAVARLRTEGIEAAGRRCDTADLADVEALRDEALALGTLDIWVNNAGTTGVYGPSWTRTTERPAAARRFYHSRGQQMLRSTIQRRGSATCSLRSHGARPVMAAWLSWSVTFSILPGHRSAFE